MKNTSAYTRLFVAFLAVSSLIFASCGTTNSDSDDDDTTSEQFILSLAYQATGFDYNYYTAGFDTVMDGSLSAVGRGIDNFGYYTFHQIDDAIYGLGGFSLTDIVAIRRTEEGELVQTGGISSFDNSLNDVIGTDDDKLVSIELSSSSDVVSLHMIDPQSVSVETTTTTATSSLSDSTIAYSGMAQSGDFLFVSYYVSNPSSFATASTDSAQVAVFSYPELEFVKVISDDRVGPIGGFGALSGLTKDENGNIYALSHTNPANGYSQFTKDAAILRIDAGTSEFNSSYIFDFNTVTEGKTTAHMVYLGDNRVFVEMNTADRADQAAWADGPLKPAILDLSAQTINYIDDVPEHAGLGRKLTSTSLFDGEFIYLVVPEEENSYVYQINPNDYSATRGAEVQANFVAGFFKL